MAKWPGGAVGNNVKVYFSEYPYEDTKVCHHWFNMETGITNEHFQDSDCAPSGFEDAFEQDANCNLTRGALAAILCAVVDKALKSTELSAQDPNPHDTRYRIGKAVKEAITDRVLECCVAPSLRNGSYIQNNLRALVKRRITSHLYREESPKFDAFLEQLKCELFDDIRVALDSSQ